MTGEDGDPSVEAARHCPACTAPLGKQTQWCARCLTPLPKAEEPPSFAPPDAFLGPPVPRRFSRTVKSDITFGFWGRVVLTIVLCVLPVVYFGLYFFPAAVIWLVAFCPLVLPSIWKKVPLGPDREV